MYTVEKNFHDICPCRHRCHLSFPIRYFINEINQKTSTDDRRQRIRKFKNICCLLFGCVYLSDFKHIWDCTFVNLELEMAISSTRIITLQHGVYEQFVFLNKLFPLFLCVYTTKKFTVVQLPIELVVWFTVYFIRSISNTTALTINSLFVLICCLRLCQLSCV